MKKWIFILISAMTLTACGDAEQSTSKEETTEKVATDTKTKEENKVVEPEAEVSELKPLTLDDFNNRYELDAESEPYIDGKFELKDGSIVYADWYFYLEGETFEYAMGKFIDGQLVQVQLDLKDGVSKEDVLSELGLSKEVGYELNEMTNVVDVVIDENFNDSNISRLPNEWD